MLETVCGKCCGGKKGRKRCYQKSAFGFVCIAAGVILLFCCTPCWFIAFLIACALLILGCVLLCKR